jgi:hypothetical protein
MKIRNGCLPLPQVTDIDERVGGLRARSAATFSPLQTNDFSSSDSRNLTSAVILADPAD